VQRLEAVQGIWTVLASTMTDDLDRTKTELTVEKIEYNVGLKDEAFTRRELEAAIR
jgi:outer membrane lipoprotein-sorting protein